MTTIVTRAGKGSPLTQVEMDANFTNLNSDKAGYTTGDGGTVTQLTSKSTGVTLNKKCGVIIMNNAALAANGLVTFTLTNSTIKATDLLVINHVATGVVGNYVFNARCGAGSADISVRNVSAASLSSAIQIAFAVIPAVTA